MKNFNFHRSIVITEGLTRILLSDLQRNESVLLPLEVSLITKNLKYKSIEKLKRELDDESKQLFDEYISYFLSKEYGYITYNSWDKNNKPLKTEYEDPSIINNIFIEVEDFSLLEHVSKEVENLFVKYLVIFTRRKLALKDFITIDKLFEKSSIEGIELYCPYNDSIGKKDLVNIEETTSRFYQIYFYSCPIKVKPINGNVVINYLQQYLTINHCGKVNMDYFNTNLPKYLEAKNFNSCLYKKIAISTDGTIKNCPAMKEDFGNILTKNISKVVEGGDLKKYWHLSKDKIQVCKKCEFRYICTDCKAFTERTKTNKEGLDISRPLKCGYDPTTGIWEEWSVSPLKSKAIEYYKKENIS